MAEQIGQIVRHPKFKATKLLAHGTPFRSIRAAQSFVIVQFHLIQEYRDIVICYLYSLTISQNISPSRHAFLWLGTKMTIGAKYDMVETIWGRGKWRAHQPHWPKRKRGTTNKQGSTVDFPLPLLTSLEKKRSFNLRTQG